MIHHCMYTSTWTHLSLFEQRRNWDPGTRKGTSPSWLNLRIPPTILLPETCRTPWEARILPGIVDKSLQLAAAISPDASILIRARVPRGAVYTLCRGWLVQSHVFTTFRWSLITKVKWNYVHSYRMPLLQLLTHMWVWLCCTKFAAKFSLWCRWMVCTRDLCTDRQCVGWGIEHILRHWGLPTVPQSHNGCL